MATDSKFDLLCNFFMYRLFRLATTSKIVTAPQQIILNIMMMYNEKLLIPEMIESLFVSKNTPSDEFNFSAVIVGFGVG